MKTTLNLNAESKKTTFKLDLENEFISKNIEYYIAGKFGLVDYEISYDEKSNIKMFENFVAHLFPQIEVTIIAQLLMKSNFQVLLAQSKDVYLIQE